MQPVLKSTKLANVCYDIRGPVLARAKQMEEDGHRIIKLNIGNPAPFGFEAPEEIVAGRDPQPARRLRLFRFQGPVRRAQGDHALHPAEEHRAACRWRTSTSATASPS